MNSLDKILTDLLSDSAALLQGLFSNARVGVYVIQDERFIFVNQRLAECFGYSQEEICSGLGPLDLTATKDHAVAQREIDRRVKGKVSGSFYAFQGVRKDDSRFDVEVFGVTTAYSGRPAIIGILIDVSARTQAERALADQLRFTEQLLDAIPSPVFCKNEGGRYVACNTAFEEYLGIPRQRLIGSTVYDIAPGTSPRFYEAADDALFAQKGKQMYDAKVSYADGSRRDVTFYKATFNKADGSLGGLVGVMLDISERKRMEEAIWREANYDSLTGLPNRRLFRDRLGQELVQAKRRGEELALLFIDLDRFKEVNDTLGHDVGDLLLCEAGRRIASVVRASDTVARSGDEYLVLLPGISDRAQGARVAREIIDRLAQPYAIEGHQAYVSASIGIAFYPADCTEPETLVSYADQAMYAAKAQGRNGYSCFQPTMQEAALGRLELSTDLRQALAENQLEVYYQPIIEVKTGALVKAEALLRWHHPVRGMVSPAEFIPIAEDIGIIGDIGDWVFRQAMGLGSRLRALGVPISLAVNISPRQFVTGSCRHWIQQLMESDLSADCLAVEITEGLLLDDRPSITETLLAFRTAGVQVSIDDFGTGYSALSYLKKFNVDLIKIDRSFIRDLTVDPSDLAITEAMIVMAHKLGIRVVAEGVETDAQMERLLDAGCDYVQGYLIAKPMPGGSFLDWCHRHSPKALATVS